MRQELCSSLTQHQHCTDLKLFSVLTTFLSKNDSCVHHPYNGLFRTITTVCLRIWLLVIWYTSFDFCASLYHILHKKTQKRKTTFSNLITVLFFFFVKRNVITFYLLRLIDYYNVLQTILQHLLQCCALFWQYRVKTCNGILICIIIWN